MNRTEYKARHRALRIARRTVTVAVNPWREPLAAAWDREARHQAHAQLCALTGNWPTQPTQRQHTIACLARYQAERRARRMAA